MFIFSLFNLKFWMNYNWFWPKIGTAQLAGVIEYINCTSAETPPHSLEYDPKQFDDEAPVLEIWGMGSTPSFPLLPGPLWPRVVAPDRILSMGQIWHFKLCANKWLMLIKLLVIHSNTWNHLTVCKQNNIE